jgi:hypothetical protein
MKIVSVQEAKVILSRLIEKHARARRSSLPAAKLV